MRCQRTAWAKVSDEDRRRAGSLPLERRNRGRVEFGRRVDPGASYVDPEGQQGKVWNNQRRRRSREAAERAVVIAVTGRRARHALVIDIDAQRCGVTEDRLEFGRDARCVARCGKRCAQRLMIGNEKKLDQQR